VTEGAAVEAAIASAHRREWGRVLAATARVARDLDLAEECVQEAYVAAIQSWVSSGIPDHPAAWLTTAAKRRAIDAIRREGTLRSKLPLLVEPEEAADEVAMHTLTGQDAQDPDDVIPDERMRLIFTCCHPALATDVALYDKLLEVWVSPVVALNRTVPLAMVCGPEAALAEVEKLEREGRLAGYHYLPAVKADLLSRIGRTGEAADSYRQAFDLAANEAERAFLAEQIADHTHRAGKPRSR
jgi:predicted RNA polymerase sigma factor